MSKITAGPRPGGVPAPLTPFFPDPPHAGIGDAKAVK